MKDITFSVVIPCYNDSRIKDSVQSCVSQSYPPHEIFIVDDGSNEPTKRIIEEITESHKLKNVKAVFLKKNSGVSAARNTGIRMSTGEYICFLDSDDIWHPEKLMRVNSFLGKFKSQIVIAHDYTYDLNEFNSTKSDLLDYERITFGQILFKNPITTPSLAFPRSSGFLLREDMRYAEDHEFLLRISRQYKIYFLNERLVFINRVVGTKGGLSGEIGKMRLGEIKMYILLCRSDWRFYPLLPFLILFSLAKHIRKVILERMF